jgi:hypothetical protein
MCLLRANRESSFGFLCVADAGRLHLCCGPGRQDHVHLRNGLSPPWFVAGKRQSIQIFDLFEAQTRHIHSGALLDIKHKKGRRAPGPIGGSAFWIPSGAFYVR